MNRIQKVVVGVLLAASSSVAMAALPSVPTQPVNISASGAPASSSNGGLIVAVWDLATNSSLVQYLGLTYSQVNITDMSAAGAFLDFGTLDKFTTTFSDALANDPSRLQYMVVAGGTNSTRGTGAAGWTDELTISGDPFGFTASVNLNTWISDVLNANPAGTDQCGRVNSCVITGNGADQRNFGQAVLGGSNLGGTIPVAASYAGAVGSELQFYETTTDFNSISVLSAGATNTWLLSSTGQLTFGDAAAVPLPAAAWLLLSGLAGLGAVGRRRQKA